MWKGIFEHRLVPFRLLLVALLCYAFTLVTTTLPAQTHESAFAENHRYIQQTPEHYFNLALEALQQKDYFSAEAYLRKVLAEDSRYQEPSGRSAWYWLGFTQEQLDQPFDAIQILEQGLDSLRNCPVPDLYLKYHLARLCAENEISNRDEQITRLTYDVFSHISPQRQPDLWRLLWDQTSCLLTQKEIMQIQQLIARRESQPGKLLLCAFRRHDPTPLSLQNEFLISFFQRAAEARKKFRDSLSPRGYDARGDFYVRLGPPYKILYDHSGTRGPVGYAIYPYEFWFYFNIHPDLYFTFVGKTGKTDFRMVEGPESVFSTFYRGRGTFFKRWQKGQTAAYLRRELYLSLAPLHETFRDRLDQLEERGSAAEALDYALLHFSADDRTHAALMDSILQSLVLGTDFTQEDIPLLLSWSSFLADNGQIRMEFYYSVSLSDLYFQSSPPTYYTSVHSQIGIFDKNYEFVDGDSLIERLELPSLDAANRKAFISQWTFQLNPDQYYLLFRFDNPNGKKQQIFRIDFRADAFPETSLCLSDIQLATDVQPSEGPGRFNKHGYFVKPLPGDKVRIGRPLFVYFEIYRLTTNLYGETKYQIDYQLYRPEEKKGVRRWIRNIFGIKRERLQVYQEKVQRTGQNPFQAEYHKLDFSDLIRGEYQLHITVTDLNSQEQASNKITIHLYE